MSTKKSKKVRVVRTRPAGPNHAVSTALTPGGAAYAYRREPCAECPWRKDSQIGAFPAEAYRHSASTAYDMADSVFGCHMSGMEKPATCAGFLLRGAAHNLAVRLRLADGEIDPDGVKSDVDLYEDYRAMAVANGVALDDPALTRCR